MSGDGPESIPTSADRRSKRPVKKRALTPVSAQAAGLEALFAKPDQAIRIPAAEGVARLRGGEGGGAPPEIMSNVQGSRSGAGSGEFHVYKASRRREYARLRQLDEEAARDRGEQEFVEKKRERETRDDEKTKRNREKREKAKARKTKGKKTGGGGRGGETEEGGGGGGKNNNGSSKTEPPKLVLGPPGSPGSNDGPTPPPTTSKNGDSNGAKATAPEPLPVADGPGLLIQDDDD